MPAGAPHTNAALQNPVDLQRVPPTLADRPVTIPANSSINGLSTPWPPQSAAYPAMPTEPENSVLLSSATQAAAPNLGTAGASEKRDLPAVAAEQQASNQSAPVPAEKDGNVVITGRKGSPEGTIAVPADQTPVAWPKVSGAPPGYPGICRYHSHVHICIHITCQTSQLA